MMSLREANPSSRYHRCQSCHPKCPKISVRVSLIVNRRARTGGIRQSIQMVVLRIAGPRIGPKGGISIHNTICVSSTVSKVIWESSDPDSEESLRLMSGAPLPT